MSTNIQLVVFDMAGTTIQDHNEVESCFNQAMEQTGLITTHDEINAMMGWSKISVFDTLWRKKCPQLSEEEIDVLISNSYSKFRSILDNHYRTQEVNPTEGTLELFSFLKERGVKIALTTGFYREVTDIILSRLGWDTDFDIHHCGNKLINVSMASDEVRLGRPAPYMLFRAMEYCGVTDVKKVVKIGDTPSDLAEGKNAGCLYSCGITNGTHTEAELSNYDNDGLFKNMYDFKAFLETVL